MTSNIGLREKLYRGDTTYGIFLLSGNNYISEACSSLSLDWIVLDMEAGAASRSDAIHFLQSLNGSSTEGLIRILKNERCLIEGALDTGACGIIVPKVDTRTEAREVRDSSFYHPKGTRGVNPVRATKYFTNMEYLQKYESNQVTIVQIESSLAIANVEEIAYVDGIDVLFIGPGDLAASYGQLGEVTGEKMDAARRKVLAACETAGKIAGIFAYSIELAQKYRDEGFGFIAIGNEIKLLQQSIAQNLTKLNS